MKYKICVLLTAIFILLILPCYAVEPGEKYIVKNIDKCYGEVKIKIRGEVDIQRDEYNFEGCKQPTTNFWKCACQQENTPIILSTKNTTKNIYDIVIEYYILPSAERGQIIREGEIIHDEGLRTLQFPNIGIGMEPKKEVKERFKFPSLPEAGSLTIIIGVIVLVLAGATLIVIALIKFMLSGSDIEDNYKPPVQPPTGNYEYQRPPNNYEIQNQQRRNTEDIDDDEFDQFIDNL